LVKLIYKRQAPAKDLIFKNESEYYEQLGILANAPNNGHTITIESNEMQGAWGKEGRIFRKNQRDINTNALQKIQSAGTTSTNARYNCNEYVLNLVNEHGFSRSVRPNQTTVNIIPANINDIRSTVPQLYLDDFDRGFEKS